MTTNRNSPDQNQEQQDNLLREGRIEEDTQSPFEQARQKIVDTTSLQEEADAEQQHKEAMTERD